MRVLVVNHTGLVSGAEVATLQLLLGLPREVRTVLACPQGPLQQRARRAGLAVATVSGMTGSLRLHPVETARGVKDLVRLGWQTSALARRIGADVVHAVSIRAGLAAAMSPGPLPPVVVNLHDVLPDGPLSVATKRIVNLRAAAIVANSRYTADAWSDGARLRSMHVVHPPVDLERHQQAESRAAERARLGLPAADPLLGVAAQITPWKGQDTAVRALEQIRRTQPDARLVLAGDTKFVDRATRFDNRTYLDTLQRLIAERGLDDAVTFLGQRDDLPDVLASLDVLLIPSWEEPFGLVMIEAMAVATPVVATSVGGPSEVISDAVNGRLVPPNRPELWADAITQLLADDGMRKRIEFEGLSTARAFGRDEYAQGLLAVYRSRSVSAAEPSAA